ncbi:hypothetical protein WDW89_18080 [Deltaproteobacteria bacterium TL4]
MRNSDGINVLCHFLELSQSSSFVGSSHGSQSSFGQEVAELIRPYQKEEGARLSARMSPKRITMLEDETFHGDQLCLVGLEAVSNYIVLETYAPHREGKTGTEELSKAMKGMPVEVIQVGSDEGKGLLNHITQGLSAHHAPDLFHPLQALSQATLLALKAQSVEAEKPYQNAVQQTQTRREQQEAFFQNRPPGRAPDFEKRIESAVSAEKLAQEKLETAQNRQTEVKDALEQISQRNQEGVAPGGSKAGHSGLCLVYDRGNDAGVGAFQTAGRSKAPLSASCSLFSGMCP